MQYTVGTSTMFQVVAERSEQLYTQRPCVDSPEAAEFVLRSMFDQLDREACIAIHLDTKHRVLAYDVVSVGSASQTFMAPREILRTALVNNAVALVVAHNHPSGDPEPSADDIHVTTRLDKACSLLGIDLLDHLVFGRDSWVSLARGGHI